MPRVDEGVDVAVAPRVVVVVAPVALTVRVCVRVVPLLLTREVTVVDAVRVDAGVVDLAVREDVVVLAVRLGVAEAETVVALVLRTEVDGAVAVVRVEVVTAVRVEAADEVVAVRDEVVVVVAVRDGAAVVAAGAAVRDDEPVDDVREEAPVSVVATIDISRVLVLPALRTTNAP